MWLDIKYSNMIGSRLNRFRIVRNNPYVANYNCPLCDDIHEKRRARGYLLEKKGKIISYCHNCGASMLLQNFLEIIDYFIYSEYKIEKLKNRWQNKKVTNNEIFNESTTFPKKQLDLGVKLSLNDSMSLEYVKNRKIPKLFYESMYHCDNINIISKKIDKYSETNFYNAPVLVIPFYDKNKSYSYLSCRSLIPDSPFRYIVLEVDNYLPKIWGIEYIDWKQPIYIFEGPIDAMCVPNSLALAGVSSDKSVEYILNHTSKDNIVFSFDNELYNRDVLKQIRKKIEQGFSVVICDKNFKGKDINEIITKEIMTPDEIYKYLKDRTFSGLRAKVELSYQLKLSHLIRGNNER